MHARDEAARGRRDDDLRGAPRRRAAESPESGLLALQRASGNAAVARLLQRREAPQTTDAPGARKGRKKGPPPKKKPAAPIHARVIGMQVVGDSTRVTISKGTEAGIQFGMRGYLAGSDGKASAEVEIVKAEGGRSFGLTKAIPDEVSRHQEVVIDPATAPESQEGKEF